MQQFEIVSKIVEIETIKRGHGIHVLPLLIKKYGGKPSSWRKRREERRSGNSAFCMTLSCIGTRRTALARSI
jgi:hypothetical protein